MTRIRKSSLRREGEQHSYGATALDFPVGVWVVPPQPIAYPGLNIEVGGYTDNVGGDDMNQTLSENRARSVRDYLVDQGVTSASITSKGFGETLPVSTNDTSTGRQQNRRVELVVSGEAIGQPMNATTGSLR